MHLSSHAIATFVAACALASCSQAPAVKSASDVDAFEGSNAIEITDATRLWQRFQNPDAKARPLVWWHWIDSNVTKEGITADLEWMAQTGFAGFQWFDIAAGAPPLVEQPAPFGSPHWRQLLEHTSGEARRLNLEMGVHMGAGWSQSGGPWVTPQMAMKKLVWASVEVEGGRLLTLDLPALPDVAGPYQDTPRDTPTGLPHMNGTIPVKAERTPREYSPPSPFAKTVRVLALPKIGAEALRGQTHQHSGLLLEHLSDGSFASGTQIEWDSERAIIETRFSSPVQLGAVRIGTKGGWPAGRAEVFHGGQWHDVGAIPGPGHFRIISPVRTFAFPTVLAERARLVLEGGPAPSLMASALGAKQIKRAELTEIEWLASSIHRPEAKGGFEVVYDWQEFSRTEPTDGAFGVDPRLVLDVTDAVTPDGSLEWDAPPGSWEIVHFGYGLTGKLNNTATEAGTGLEVDKLNPHHVNDFLDGWLKTLPSGPAGEPLVDAMLLDSWEAGTSNWTEAMAAEFEQRRGYSIWPYLPALRGDIVGDRDRADAFLADFRLTLAEMLADHHNSVLHSRLQKVGLSLYAESMGARAWVYGDGIDLKSRSDFPMAEFWYSTPGDLTKIDQAYVKDVREAAAVAEIYDKEFVAAEALTLAPTYAPWSQGPQDLKWVADRFFAEGASRLVLHSSDHQPISDARPGVTMWEIGQFLTRHETWSREAKHLVSYFSRVSSLMQAGRHSADIAVFVGDTPPITAPFWQTTKQDVPPGFDYFYVNAAALEKTFTVVAGQLQAPSGLSAKLLVIPSHVSEMRSETVCLLSRLQSEGLTIISQSEDALISSRADSDEALIACDWRPSEETLDAAIERLDFGPMLALGDHAALDWRHRRIGSTGLYFIANATGYPITTAAAPRLGADWYEVWDPISGDCRQRGMMSANERSLDLSVGPNEALFLVTGTGATSPATCQASPPTKVGQIMKVEGPWSIDFEPIIGDPMASVRWDKLEDFSQSEKEDIRYFSGTARYRATFTLSRDPNEPTSFTLALGDVGEMARVVINGHELGIDWLAPYEFAIPSHVLREGSNELEVHVTNLWANRLIGDAIAREDGRKIASQATFVPYGKGTIYAAINGEAHKGNLLPSGLIGPVTLQETRR
ncbi:MAG: glycosyl hydrolase [Parvularcula sp.]|nr:glycosyl hydrolase [Parvularcula sp.]